MKYRMNRLYDFLFSEYPDIVTVKQMQDMLHISRHIAYDLIRAGAVGSIKMGNTYRIPKINIINYIVKVGMVDAMLLENDIGTN